MSKPKIVEVDPQDIPEVARHLEVKMKLDNLKAAYPGVFEELAEVVDEYNQSLETAEQAVRSRQVTCGPFSIISFTEKYDADLLFDSVGRDDFLRYGGSETTVVNHGLDKKVFASFVSQNKVPSNVVDAVTKTSPSYRTPKKIVIP